MCLFNWQRLVIQIMSIKPEKKAPLFPVHADHNHNSFPTRVRNWLALAEVVELEEQPVPQNNFREHFENPSACLVLSPWYYLSFIISSVIFTQIYSVWASCTYILFHKSHRFKLPFFHYFLSPSISSGDFSWILESLPYSLLPLPIFSYIALCLKSAGSRHRVTDGVWRVGRSG